METILKLNQIHKSYGGKEVLKGVSLDVQKGEIISVLGPSGCGKSTLLNIIAGILPINEGHVLLNGVEVTSPGKMTPIEKRDLNMVFQDFALWPHMTARENVLYGLKLRKTCRKWWICSISMVSWNNILRNCPAVSSSVWRLPEP